MKKKGVQLILLAIVMVFFGCSKITDNSNNNLQDNLFFEAAKNTLPSFKNNALKSAQSNWNNGWPIFELYTALKDFDPSADTGSNKTGLDNIYKTLYQTGLFYNDCINSGTASGDIKLLSPYDFGRTDNTYNTFLNQESSNRANYLAAKRVGSVNYCLLCWYIVHADGLLERGILQGYFDEGSGDLNLDLVCFGENAGFTGSHRMHIEGNSITHQFNKLIMAKWNDGSNGYRVWFVGSGIAKGTGNMFLFKIKDNSSLSTDQYFEFPSDADVTTLQDMSDLGSATTGSPFKNEVDDMISGKEYFNVIAASPVPDQIPSSAAHFHGAGMGNMKPAAETQTELEGKWYGKGYNLAIQGNYFQLNNTKTGDWFTGEISVNMNATPKTIDLIIQDGNTIDFIEKTVLGIFKIDTGILILKVNDAENIPRPVDFSYTADGMFAFSKDPNNLPTIPGAYKDFPLLPLDFHYANPGEIVAITGFAVPPMNEQGGLHNGIDLKINTMLTKSTIISPTNGTIKSISYNTTDSSAQTPGLLMVHVEIYINSSYTLYLIFEPSSSIDFLSNQMSAIKVTVGQEIKTGDIIGDLLVGQYDFPHIHIMLVNKDESSDLCLCPYKYSSDAVKALYDQIATTYGGNLCDGKICCLDSFSSN